MEFFKYTKPYSFMAKSKIAIAISLIFMSFSYFMLVTKGLNYGIDFAGGTIVQVKYDKKAPLKEIREIFKKQQKYEVAAITEFGSPDEIVIRLKNSSKSVGSDIGDEIAKVLKGSGKFEIRRVDMVGPKVGSELREKGLIAMVLAIAVILIYVAFRFEWRFALASIFALVHDVSIALGFISLFEIDVNLDVLAALLTLLGYSLNDTIIVFDRIREGITTSKETDLSKVIDESVTKTLSRTTLTSLTTFFVILTLFLWGGEIIHPFSFTMLVGVIVGTYSSIFVASPILIWLGFSIKDYRAKLAEKAKREAEKERLRNQFEGGIV